MEDDAKHEQKVFSPEQQQDLIIEGMLYKLSDHWRVWKQRYFQLVGQKLLVFYNITDPMPRYALDLTDAQIRDDGETDGDKFCFTLILDHPSKDAVVEYFFAHKKREVFREWVKSLKIILGQPVTRESMYEKYEILKVKLLGGKEVEDAVYYDTQVSSSRSSWFISKRYSDYEDLHNLMRLVCVNHELPLFPEKKNKFFHNHKSPQFISDRIALLNSYLSKLMRIRDVRSSREFVQYCFSDKIDTSQFVGEDDDIRQFPDDQEVIYEITNVDIPATRVMTDHILFRIDVSNYRLAKEYMTWTRLKRFAQLVGLDEQLKLEAKSNFNSVAQFPEFPAKRSKVWTDHMDPYFIEERRVLVENYLRKLLFIPWVAKTETFLAFMGVDLDVR